MGGGSTAFPHLLAMNVPASQRPALWKMTDTSGTARADGLLQRDRDKAPMDTGARLRFIDKPAIIAVVRSSGCGTSRSGWTGDQVVQSPAGFSRSFLQEDDGVDPHPLPFSLSSRTRLPLALVFLPLSVERSAGQILSSCELSIPISARPRLDAAMMAFQRAAQGSVGEPFGSMSVVGHSKN